MIGIYKITNLLNNKVYIGQAQDIEERWKQHKKGYTDKTNIIYRAIRKYGVENFSFEVIEECSIEELSKKEIFYIEQYKSYIGWKDNWGYNMTLGGDGARGHIPTKETKQKISDANKGKNHPLYGKTHTEEAKQKISEALKGRRFSEETLQKMRKSKSKSNSHSHSHSEETLQKMSEVKKGNKHSAKKVVCGNKMFNSLRECSEFYKISYSTMSNWLYGRNLGSEKAKYYMEKLNLHYATEEEVRFYKKA